MSTPAFRKITSVDWSSKLNAWGEVVEGLDDIRQAIQIILTTQPGSVPHRLDFGCDLARYIDWPPATAVPHLMIAAQRALERWEPRALVESIEVKSQAQPGHYLLIISWRPQSQYLQEQSNLIWQEVSI